MPVFLVVSICLTMFSLALAVRASSRRRIIAWAVFGFLAAPVLIAGIGGMVLASGGLAWRSCVKLPCALAYVAGILILTAQAGAFLWKLIEGWKPAARGAGRFAILAVTAILLLAVGWYGLLFGAIWAGGDREAVVKGERMVMEYAWMDQDYYAYHSPLTRGSERLYGSWELNKEDFGEAEP
ncbi:MAG: hypothetical protein HFF69_02640 [Oscillospiraceae bacterium]|jgi:hypothetical protein|nr:hypothetical protein [Oscillospiraceae bacterium]